MEIQGKNILLGVTSSVAIYKACSLIGRSKHMGANVKVVMTKNASELITPRYFAELTGHAVAMELFGPINQHEVEHISLANWADLALIAPASYNIIGKVASGIADDMLSTVIAAIPKDKTPIIFAPAMNTQMWNNPILQDNIQRLENFRYYFIAPSEGKLACGTTGIGKMQSPDKIIEYILNL